MFIEFKVGNFRSFRDIQKFSLQASPLRKNDGGLEENNVFNSADFRLLKSKAIYGANASGKSNLVKAIGIFTIMVSKSVAQEHISKQIWDERFRLITNWDDQPVYFELTFLVEEKIFRYGFQVLQDKIVYEWLFGGDDNSEKQYFIRKNEEVDINENNFTGTTLFLEEIKNGHNEIFRSDSLFLTAAALNGNKLAAKLRNEITSIITVDGVKDEIAMLFATFKLDTGTEEDKTSLKDLLIAAGTGIDDLEVLDVREPLEKSSTAELLKTKKRLVSIHKRYDDEGNFAENISVSFKQWESEGTSKLLSTGAYILEVLSTGTTLIIDEFDASLHPNLTLQIVKLFNNVNSNPKNAQFVFVTHDTGLLRRAKLRRDQICFVDKDQFGLSSIRTLIEYKGVRKDASYEKEYLNGNYGGIASLDIIDSVIKNDTATHE